MNSKRDISLLKDIKIKENVIALTEFNCRIHFGDCHIV